MFVIPDAAQTRKDTPKRTPLRCIDKGLLEITTSSCHIANPFQWAAFQTKVNEWLFVRVAIFMSL